MVSLLVLYKRKVFRYVKTLNSENILNGRWEDLDKN
jgi:hypothetical protein